MLGDYVVRRALGAGANGRVFEAYHRTDRQRVVAIKQVHFEHTAEPEAERRRFSREAELLRTVDHPDVVKFIAHEDDLLVMEFCPWPSLRQRLEAGPIRGAAAVRLVLHVVGVLRYLHSKRIFHRDIKPENILVHESRMMLVDFGTSFQHELPKSQHMAFLGTPAYAPPEAFQCSPLDVNGELYDLYSLGIVLYEMLTGTNPFRVGPAQYAFFDIAGLKNRLESLDPGPEFTTPIRELIRRLTSRDPAARPQDADEVEDSLFATLDLDVGRPSVARSAIDDRFTSPPMFLFSGLGAMLLQSLKIFWRRQKWHVLAALLTTLLGVLVAHFLSGGGGGGAGLTSPFVPSQVAQDYPSCSKLVHCFPDAPPPTMLDDQTWRMYCTGLIRREKSDPCSD